MKELKLLLEFSLVFEFICRIFGIDYMGSSLSNCLSTIIDSQEFDLPMDLKEL